MNPRYDQLYFMKPICCVYTHLSYTTAHNCLFIWLHLTPARTAPVTGVFLPPGPWGTAPSHWQSQPAAAWCFFVLFSFFSCSNGLCLKADCGYLRCCWSRMGCIHIHVVHKHSQRFTQILFSHTALTSGIRKVPACSLLQSQRPSEGTRATALFFGPSFNPFTGPSVHTCDTAVKWSQKKSKIQNQPWALLLNQSIYEAVKWVWTPLKTLYA